MEYFAEYCCDFETEKDKIIIATFVRTFVLGEIFSINGIDDVNYCFSFKDMLDCIVHENYDKKRKYPTIRLWFTNSSKFDGSFILAYLLQNDYEQILSKNIKKFKKNQFSLLENNKIGILDLTFKYKGFLFSVRDFKQHVSLSVAKKGDIIGIEKGVHKNIKYEWIDDDNNIIWEKIQWDKETCC